MSSIYGQRFRVTCGGRRRWRSCGGLLGDGPEEDEILVQEGVELGVVVELLTEQFAAPSGVGVEVDENQLVLDLGLGDCLVQ